MPRKINLYALESMTLQKNYDLVPESFPMIEKTSFLAQKIFPYTSKSNARRLFTRLCNETPALSFQLKKLGWNTKQVFITNAQIKVILEYLKNGYISFP